VFEKLTSPVMLFSPLNKATAIYSTMSDSILINMLLNEDNALENTWIIYIVFAILTGLYCIWYNLFKSMVYAGISLEIVLRIIEFFVQSALVWAFRRRHPTMVGI
jgi:uncharacterized membrane protein YqjE